MTDPLSVTGSAVGVVSLGLTVCQSILAYYGPYKAFHEEIDDIVCQTENLTKTLGALEEILNDTENSDTARRAESSKIAMEAFKYCYKKLKKLDGMLKKCRKVNPSQGSLKNKLSIDRMTYPFRRDTLMALVKMLDRLQSNLNTALLVLNYAILTNNGKRMEMAISNSASAASDTSQVLDVVRDLSKTKDGFEEKLDSINSRLAQMETIIVQQHIMQSMLSPSMLRLLLDNQHELEKDINQTALNVSSRLKGPRSKCTCSHNSVAVVSTRQVSASKHSCRDRCPLHTSERRLASISTQHVFCNWLLKCSISISLEITQGAGGISISPSLRFHTIVPEDSPAFKLLDEKMRMVYKAEGHEYSKVNDILHDTLQVLLEMFRSGRASPTDTLPNGDTILHVITRWAQLTRQWSPNSLIQWRRFIKSLLNNYALPNMVNNIGETPVDILMQSLVFFHRGGPLDQSAIDICSDLTSAGGYMTLIGLYKYSIHLYSLYSNMLILPRAAAKVGFESGEFPEHLCPVLSKSEPDLKDLLKCGTDMTEVIDYYVLWPGGLALLLKSGYVPSCDTLAAAFTAGCKESIKLLLQTKSLCIDFEWMYIVSRSHDQEILEIAVQEFASRRKRLQVLAQTYLSSEGLSRLRIQPDHLLDNTAGDACQLLKAASVDIGFAESEISWLVYHQTGCNMVLADLLWKAGFRDVNGRDSQGYTSLMKLDGCIPMYSPAALLKKIQWLITKGADPHKTRKSSPAVFYICYDLGKFMGFYIYEDKCDSEIQQIDEQCLELMRLMLFDPCRDTCNCSYSLGGCSSLSRYLDGFFSPLFSKEKIYGVFRNLASALDSIANALCPSCPECILDSMAPVVLSFITSRALDITHTCACNIHNEDSRKRCQDFPTDEVADILYVEDNLLQKHEDLLDEFLVEYEKQDEPLPCFITGYWSDRMSQALSSDEVSAEERARNLREIGVILSDTDSDGSDVWE